MYRYEKDGAIYFNGRISSHACALQFQLSPAIPQNNPSAPSHRIVARANTGADAVIGSAWTKIMIRGPRKGQDFYTLTFNHPSLLKSLNVAAFPTDRPGEYVVTFRKRQRTAA
jgi:uncharacterized protein (DUF736 family)